VTTAGVVLAGGRSVRMGSPKAALRWRGTSLLAHTCEVLSTAVDGPVVVVRAPAQTLPVLPRDVEVLADTTEGLGPVQGLAVGLRALVERADVAFVAATDLPYLHPEFVRRVVRALVDAAATEVVLPVAHGFPHPLAGAYRTALAPAVEQAIQLRQLRLMGFVEGRDVIRLDEAQLLAADDLARADPSLRSLVNLNEPGEYARALAASKG